MADLNHKFGKNRWKQGLSGLDNLGNTCFMNSVIQCLRHTIPLNNALFEAKNTIIVQKNLDRQLISQPQIDLLHHYLKVVDVLWHYDNCRLTPLGFRKHLAQMDPFYCNPIQHDAHEFLVMMLNIFHELLSKNVTYSITGKIINQLDLQIAQAHDDWLAHYKQRHSVILDIFSGQLQTTIVCDHCHQIHYKYDPFMHLDLPLLQVSDGRPYDLLQCFDRFFTTEKLDEQNLYQCDHCHQKTRATKTIALWTLPDILIIKLNRFKNLDSHTIKINDWIDFPIEQLNILKYNSSPLNSLTKYHLYAIICHEGTTNAGHYWAECLHSSENQWYRFNDTHVSSIRSTDNLITSSVYVLFYQKIKF